MSDNKKIHKEGAGKPLTAMDRFWLETGKDAVKVACNKQEEAAKQIISITSVLQGIYFAAISFSDLRNALVAQEAWGGAMIAFVAFFVSPTIIWLISLGFAVRVVVPVTRYTSLNSPDLLKKMYQEAIDYKSKYLWRAHMALMLGFVPLVVNIVIYLVWMR